MPEFWNKPRRDLEGGLSGGLFGGLSGPRWEEVRHVARLCRASINAKSFKWLTAELEWVMAWLAELAWLIAGLVELEWLMEATDTPSCPDVVIATRSSVFLRRVLSPLTFNKKEKYVECHKTYLLSLEDYFT